MDNELIDSQVSEVHSAILENLNNLVIILNEDLEMTYLNENALKSLALEVTADMKDSGNVPATCLNLVL